MSDFNIKDVKVHRTLEGNIFELVTAIILVVTYAVAIATKAFDFKDMLEDSLGIIFLSIIPIVLLFLAYSPKSMHFGGEPKNIRQVELSIRAIRIIAVEMAFFCLMMVVISPDVPILPAALSVTIVGTAAYYSAKIRLTK